MQLVKQCTVSDDIHVLCIVMVPVKCVCGAALAANNCVAIQMSGQVYF